MTEISEKRPQLNEILRLKKLQSTKILLLMTMS